METEQINQVLEDAAKKAYPTNTVQLNDSLTIDVNRLLRRAFEDGWKAAIHFQEEKQTDLSKRMDAFLDQNLPKKVSDYVEIFTWLSEKDYLSDKMEYIMEEYEHTKQ